MIANGDDSTQASPIGDEFSSPLGVIRTKLQAQMRGGRACVVVDWCEQLNPSSKRMVCTGRIRALVLGYFPTWMVYFTVYEANKPWKHHETTAPQKMFYPEMCGGSSDW